MTSYNEEFWMSLDELVNKSEIVIDRPKGSAHPRSPDFIYHVDYGYLKDTASMDGQGLMFGLEAIIKRLMLSCVLLIC